MVNHLILFAMLLSPAAKAELIEIEGYGNQKEAEASLAKTFQQSLKKENVKNFLNNTKNGKLKVLLGSLIFSETKDLQKGMDVCGEERNHRQCWYGVMSAFAAKKAGSDQEKFLTELFQLNCFKEQNSLLPICSHSAGHAFFEYTKGAIPVALKLCSDRRIPQTAISFCESGVFNRYFLQHRSVVVKDNKIDLTPCSPDKTLSLCLKYKFIAAKEEDKNLENNYGRYCHDLNRYANECFSAIGGSIEAEQLKNKNKKISDLCAQGNTNERWSCYRTVFKTFLYEIGTKEEAALNCSSLYDKSLQKKCLSFINKTI